jgi:hypothetical protein
MILVDEFLYDEQFSSSKQSNEFPFFLRHRVAKNK